ncbi:hypothetical protein EDD11_009261 [Mortierella claussenii]|nr:hypothetical protein EDD11_009261 [Mortierella claussenii]
MLSTISRQTLRVTRSRAVQSVSTFRCYSSDSNDNTDNTESNVKTESKPAKSEALLNILSGSNRVNAAKANSSSNAHSAAMIMETLTRATDRQKQNPLSGSTFLNSGRSSLGSNAGSSFGRLILSETQTCTHNLHIHATMNNTVLTLTDSNGDPITTQSAGTAGLKKSARSGPEAGYQAMTKLIEKVEEKNVQIQTLHVLMKGFGPGRDSAFKAIRAKTTWDIKRISDTTPIPFNGCRPPKMRRL